MISRRSIHRDAFAGKKVLVTGGAGFIGSHLVQALVELDAKVIVLDDLSGGDWNNLSGFGSRSEQITGSITDIPTVKRAIAGCEFVFHQAALGSVPRSVEQPELYFNVNVTGTLNVLQQSKAAGPPTAFCIDIRAELKQHIEHLAAARVMDRR